MSHHSSIDVAIIGAGPAGSALAIRLAGSGINVSVIERSSFKDFRVGESLAPSVGDLLRDVNLKREFLSLDPLPSYGVKSLWGSGQLEYSSHIASPNANGWHIDRSRSDAMMAEAANQAGASLYCNSQLSELRYEAGYWHIALDSREKPMRARMLVDATGRSARVARRIGGRRILFDRLVGVCCRYECSYEHEQRSILLEARPEGWWYSAPVTRTQLMVTLMTDSDLCGARGYSVVNRWTELISGASETSKRLFKEEMSTRVGTPVVVSAVSQRICRQSDRRPWLAVGDSSLAMDPVSGSGVVRALRGAEKAYHCIVSLLENCGTQAIEKYENEIDGQCTHYLYERKAYYAVENRFKHAPFWMRRLPAPAVPTPAVPTPAVPTPAVPTPAVPTPAVPTPAVPAHTLPAHAVPI